MINAAEIVAAHVESGVIEVVKVLSPLSVALAAGMTTDREPHVGAPVVRTYVG